MKCNCTMAQKTVGDGCEVCNPAPALQFAKENIQQLESAKAEVAEFIKWAMENKRSELSDVSFQLGMDLLSKHRS